MKTGIFTLIAILSTMSYGETLKCSSEDMTITAKVVKGWLIQNYKLNDLEIVVFPNSFHINFLGSPRVFSKTTFNKSDVYEYTLSDHNFNLTVEKNIDPNPRPNWPELDDYAAMYILSTSNWVNENLSFTVQAVLLFKNEASLGALASFDRSLTCKIEKAD